MSRTLCTTYAITDDGSEYVLDGGFRTQKAAAAAIWNQHVREYDPEQIERLEVESRIYTMSAAMFRALGTQSEHVTDVKIYRF